jgi:hypothetical protein
VTFANSTSANLIDIKTRLDCQSLTESVLGSPKSRGTTWWLFRAPNRPDEHPSFGVRPDGYFDFATGERGDVFNLLGLLYGLNGFAETLRMAQELLGGVSPALSRQPRPALKPRKSEAPPPPAWQEAALSVLAYAEDYLWSDRPDAVSARDYLLEVRGLTEATIRRFRLGFNPRWKKTSWRKPEDDRYASLPPGIVIPCLADGQVWYITVRCIVGNLAQALSRPPEKLYGELSPKYLQLAGGNPEALYNADALAEETPDKPALITEGQFDALLTAQLAGDLVNPITVGSASNSLAPRFLAQLERAPLVLLCLDNDAAGQRGTARLKSRLRGPVRHLALPAGKDLTEYVMEQQGDLPALIAAALTDPQPAPAAVNPDELASLPDALRAALNAYAYPAIAPTLELHTEAIRAGLVAPEDYVSIKQFVQIAKVLGRETSPDTIKKGLQAGAGHFWEVLQTDLKKGESDSGVDQAICKTPQNPTGPGRRAAGYRLLPTEVQVDNLLGMSAPRILESCFPADEATIAPVESDFLMVMGHDPRQASSAAWTLSAAYHKLITAQPELRTRLNKARLIYDRLVRDLDSLRSTPLPPDWRYRNAAEYVSVFARALVAADPAMQQSRAVLARTLGSGGRNVGAILTRAGVRNERQTVEQPIYSVSQFSALKPAYSPQYKGFPVRVMSISGDTLRERTFSPEAESFVESELAAGSHVYISYQQASRQVIVTETQPEPTPRKRHEDQAAPPAQTVPPVPEHTPELPKPKPPRYFGPGPDPAWCANWAVKLLEKATPWALEGEVIRQRETGELLPYSPRQVIALLLEAAQVVLKAREAGPPDDRADEG